MAFFAVEMGEQRCRITLARDCLHRHGFTQRGKMRRARMSGLPLIFEGSVRPLALAPFIAFVKTWRAKGKAPHAKRKT
jgi:hypothetical protein